MTDKNAVEDVTNSETAATPRKLHSFLMAEAVIVAASTAAVYLFSYFFQKSYLAVFNVPASFIELTLTTVVVAAASMLALIVSIWNLLSFLHYKLVEGIVKLTLANTPVLLIVFFTVAAIWSTGFTWLTFILFLIAATVALCSLFSLLSAVFFGPGYSEWVNKEIRAEADFRRQTVSNKILDQLSREVSILLLLFLLIPFSTGTISGGMTAKRAQQFLAMEIEDKTFIIVSEYRDGLVLASVEPSRTEKGIFFPTGDVVWSQLSSISEKPLRATTMRLHKKPVATDSEWIGLTTFVWRLFGYAEELDRR